MADVRELIIRLVAETTQAESNLRVIEDRIKALTREFSSGAITADKYDKELRELSVGAASVKQHISDLERETKKHNTASQQTIATGDKLIGMVTRYAGPAVLGLAIKQTIAWADNLSDLSDQTNISITNLQKLERAAAANGKSLTTVTDAVFQLSKRLGDGDKSAVAAVKALGFNLEDVLRMDPADAFLKLGMAASGLNNPMQKAATQAALFGRSGKELDGVLKSLNSDMGLMPSASAEAVSALGRLSDAFTAAKIAGKALLTDVLGRIVQGGAGFTGGSAAFGTGQAWGQSMVRSWLGIPSAPGSPNLAGSPLATPGLPPDIKALEDSFRGEIEANKRLIRATDAAANAVIQLPAWMQAEFNRRIAGGGMGVPTPLPFPSWGIGTGGVLLPSSPLPGGGMVNVPNIGSGYVPGVGTGSFGNRFGSAFFPGLANVALSAFQGGGSLVSSLGGLAGGALGTAFTKAGTFLGNLVPGLGTVLGGLLPRLFSLPMFGGPTAKAREDAAIQPQIDALIQQALAQYGGRAGLATAGSQVGVDVLAAFGSKGKAGYEHLSGLLQELATKQADLNSRLAEQLSLESQIAALKEAQVPTWAKVNGIVEKYGLNIDGLGQKLQQMKQNDFATQLLNDMTLLFDAGADVGGVLSQMSGQISKLVTDSLKFGTTIPSNMKPYIDELLRAGLLVDENGTKLTDLSKLKWGDPVKTEAEKFQGAIDLLVLKLDELIESIKRDFPNAVKTGVEDGQRILDGTQWRAPDITGPDFETGDGNRYMHGGPVYAARGGFMRGTDSVLAALTPGEFVLNREAVKRIGRDTLHAINRGAGAGGGPTVVVNVDASGAVFDNTTAARFADKVGEHLMRRAAFRGLRFSGVGA